MSGKEYLGGTRIKKIYIGSTQYKKAFLGNINVFSSAHLVSYHIDTNNIIQQEVDDGADCIAWAPVATKTDWDCHGWREDSVADSDVLATRICDEEGIELYTVFKKSVTASYLGNGATGGSTSPQEDFKYYNNGNSLYPTFILSNNGFSRTGYTFVGWAEGSASGTRYAAGSSRQLQDDTNYYAIWKRNEQTVSIGGSIGLGVRDEGVHISNITIDCTDYTYAEFTCRLNVDAQWNNLDGFAICNVSVGVNGGASMAFVAEVRRWRDESSDYPYDGFGITPSGTVTVTANISNLSGYNNLIGYTSQGGYGGGIDGSLYVEKVRLYNP